MRRLNLTIVVIVCSILVAIVGRVVGDDDDGGSTALGTCSSHCSTSAGKHADCWHKTRDFFERSLALELRSYTISIANAALAAPSSSDWNETSRRIVQRLVAHEKPLVDAEKRKDVDAATFTRIVDAIVSNARNLVDTIEPRALASAPADCPLQCERDSTPLKRMFIASSVGTVFLFGIIIGLSIVRYRRIKRAIQRETDTAMRTFEKNRLSQRRKSYKLVNFEF